jgi:hypothetical protein
MQRILFGIWFVLTILAALLVLLLRHRRTSKWVVRLNEVFDLALAVLGGVSGGYVIFQTGILHYDELQKLVGNEGCVAMVLGGLASIWFGVGKIKELVVKP